MLDSWNRELVLWSCLGEIVRSGKVGYYERLLVNFLLNRTMIASLQVGGAVIYVHVH
jgi:hypothetical protein